MRKLRISFADEKVEAFAVLLDEKAPSTCDCLWKALEKPVEQPGQRFGRDTAGMIGDGQVNRGIRAHQRDVHPPIR